MKQSLFFMLLYVGISGFSQKIDLVEGDLGLLKGQDVINIKFRYDMAVAEFDKEDRYIAHKKRELNKKEKGRGDKWVKSWKADRKDRFEPQFRALFIKHSEIAVIEEPAPYTIIFTTIRTEPGSKVGDNDKPAFIDGEARLVETSNPKKIIAKIVIENVPGRDVMGFDYETGARLQEAYAKAGKEIGGFIRKKLK